MLTILKSEVENRLIRLIENVLSPLSLLVVDVDCVLVGHRRIGVFVERVGSSGATLDDCSVASGVIGKMLESEKFVGPFDLEVSSPGLDRRLRTESDFKRQIGAEAKLRLCEPQEGRANVRGAIVKVDDGLVEIGFDGRTMIIPVQSIRRANLVWKEE